MCEFCQLCEESESKSRGGRSRETTRGGSGSWTSGDSLLGNRGKIERG
jgi:hypothetical protein